VSLAALPLLKPDIERTLHYAKLSSATENTEDTSIHYHVNYDYLGSTTDEIERTVSNMLWFLFDNREWMREFTGRRGDGEDLANMNYFLGNIDGSLSYVGLKKRFINTKASILEIIKSGGCISRDIKDKEVAHDDRVKGFFNIILNDKFRTLEFRWFGSTTDVDTYMTQYEFMYAWVNAAKQNYLIGNTETTSMEKFKAYVERNKANYPLLAKEFEFHVPFALEYPEYSEEDLLNFNYKDESEFDDEEEDEELEDEDEEFEGEYDEDESDIEIPLLKTRQEYLDRYFVSLSRRSLTKTKSCFCDECSEPFPATAMYYKSYGFENLGKSDYKQLCAKCADMLMFKSKIKDLDKAFCPIALTFVPSEDCIQFDESEFAFMSGEALEFLAEHNFATEHEKASLVD
jgi:hypothetical protein